MSRSGWEKVGDWTLKHASAVSCEYKHSVSGEKPKILQSFLVFTDLFALCHYVKEDWSMPRSWVITIESMSPVRDEEDRNLFFR
jgi:hypothetical protein